MNVRIFFKSGGYTEVRINTWNELYCYGEDIKTVEVL